MQINISEQALNDLKQIANWYDFATPQTMIEKLIIDEMEHLGMVSSQLLDAETSDDILEPIDYSSNRNVDDRMAIWNSVKDCKLLEATVQGQVLHRCNWNSLLVHVIEEVNKEIQSPIRLANLLNVNARAENLQNTGFKYYSQLGVAIQGQSATQAFTEVKRLAKVYNISVKLAIRGRQNASADMRHNVRTIEF